MKNILGLQGLTPTARGRRVLSVARGVKATATTIVALSMPGLAGFMIVWAGR